LVIVLFSFRCSVSKVFEGAAKKSGEGDGVFYGGQVAVVFPARDHALVDALASGGVDAVGDFLL